MQSWGFSNPTHVNRQRKLPYAKGHVKPSRHVPIPHSEILNQSFPFTRGGRSPTPINSISPTRSIISRSIASPKIPCKSSRPSTKKSIIPTLRSVSKTSSIGIHDAKGAHFNGAYYGAPQGVTVPPPHAYHRPPRGRGCGPCCILTTLLKLVITIMVILGIAALVAWLILHPNKLDISIRNPNKKIGICYDKVDAMAYYEGERFSWASLPAFYQGHKNTTVLQPKFTGQQLMLLNSYSIPTGHIRGILLYRC
ncbi:hypothetical protein AMTR_s00030p00214230 [Amborella trichopoda]|uniref:Late embryogenesis abundant protein LEA-2 subgroup domain-containing protein n=1 Tax=Amborella trichopoda TaxID=13333 RepID=U5CSC9_AMBTC|nr:hypothetical protein AMTR_s00030p00214230 [Amborella trichopoda]